jgi:Holliday junction resolvase RusA-like endonuclease
VTFSVVLDVRVYGLPVPQGRPRARAFRLPNGVVKASVYERAEDKDWKRTVEAQLVAHKPPAPVDGPLCVTLAFTLPRPASLPKRVEYPMAHRRDVDNLAKGVMDAAAGLIYRDDAQIVDLSVSKRFGASPGVHIRVAHALPLRVAPAQGALVAAGGER